MHCNPLLLAHLVSFSTLALLVAQEPGDTPRSVDTLKSGDIVSINVFDEGSLSGAFSIGPGGKIVFPLLGSIPAAGETPERLASIIESRLEQDYIRDAQVAVAFAEKAELPPETITVIGQVASPGQIPYEAGSPIDLFTAVATAGGLTDQGDRNRIELKRRDSGDLRTQTLNLEGDRVFPLRDGDTLIVHSKPIVATKVEKKEVYTVTVIGEVKNPGQVPINPEKPLDIIAAIAIAGGFTDIARPAKVVVRRTTAEGIKTFEVNVSKMQRDQTTPFLLAPNDTITVPESIF